MEEGPFYPLAQKWLRLIARFDLIFCVRQTYNHKNTTSAVLAGPTSSVLGDERESAIQKKQGPNMANEEIQGGLGTPPFRPVGTWNGGSFHSARQTCQRTGKSGRNNESKGGVEKM